MFRVQGIVSQNFLSVEFSPFHFENYFLISTEENEHCIVPEKDFRFRALNIIHNISNIYMPFLSTYKTRKDDLGFI